MGGYASFLVFANLPQVQAAVPMIGVPSFTRRWLDLLDECAFSNPEWATALDRVTEQTRQRTAFVQEIDPIEKLKDAAPRALLIMNCDFDSDQPKAYAIDCYRELRTRYAQSSREVETQHLSGGTYRYPGDGARCSAVVLPDTCLIDMPTSHVKIRYATPADNTLLAELGAQTFYETFAANNTPEDMAAYLAASFSPAKQAAELADPASTFLIAENDDATIGYARLKIGQPAARCDRREAHRNCAVVRAAGLAGARCWSTTDASLFGRSRKTRLRHNLAGCVGTERASACVLSQMGLRRSRHTALSTRQRSAT